MLREQTLKNEAQTTLTQLKQEMESTLKSSSELELQRSKIDMMVKQTALQSHITRLTEEQTDSQTQLKQLETAALQQREQRLQQEEQ